MTGKKRYFWVLIVMVIFISGLLFLFLPSKTIKPKSDSFINSQDTNSVSIPPVSALPDNGL